MAVKAILPSAQPTTRPTATPRTTLPTSSHASQRGNHVPIEATEPDAAAVPAVPAARKIAA